jgi:hypothetical protein
MNPKAALESVLALQERFGIPFLMAGSPQVAARLCESILMRWRKEHTKVLEEIRIATKKAVRTAPSRSSRKVIPRSVAIPELSLNKKRPARTGLTYCFLLWAFGGSNPKPTD